MSSNPFFDDLTPRRQHPGVVDITPQPWWRRAARVLKALAIILVAVPLTWFAGAIFGMVILVGAAAMLVYAAFRSGSHQPPGTAAMRGGTSPPS